MVKARRFSKLVCAAGLALASCASGPDLQAIGDRAQRIEIPGVSVLAPSGEHWFMVSTPKAQRAAMMTFMKRSPDVGPGVPENPRSVYAAVMVIDMRDTKFASPDEFLEDRKRELAAGTRRQRVVEFDARLDSSMGATCVRGRQVTEMKDVPIFRGSPSINLTQRLYCLHPHWPQYLINILHSQHYRAGGAPLPLDAEAEAFLRGVGFTESRPVPVN